MTVSTIVLIYFTAGIVGGLARVYRHHGAKGFQTPKLTVDAIFSAAGGVLYPYLVPTIVTERVPILAIALGIAALTYWANHLFIVLLKRAFGYTSPNGEMPPNGEPKS